MVRTHVILVHIKVGQTANAKLVDADADGLSTLSKARSLSKGGRGTSLTPKLACLCEKKLLIIYFKHIPQDRPQQGDQHAFPQSSDALFRETPRSRVPGEQDHSRVLLDNQQVPNQRQHC